MFLRRGALGRSRIREASVRKLGSEVVWSRQREQWKKYFANDGVTPVSLHLLDSAMQDRHRETARGVRNSVGRLRFFQLAYILKIEVPIEVCAPLAERRPPWGVPVGSEGRP